MSETKPNPNNEWVNQIDQKAVQSLFLNETVTCAKDTYEKALVQSGQAKDINEAKTFEPVPCSCPKCVNKFL